MANQLSPFLSPEWLGVVDSAGHDASQVSRINVHIQGPKPYCPGESAFVTLL
jgi:hypothetical protein